MKPPFKFSKAAAPQSGSLVARVTKMIAAPRATGPWTTALPYPRLLTLDCAAAGLVRQAGVYACWHLGVRPRWLRVGGGADVAALLQRLQRHELIAACEAHGGVFVAWALMQPAAIAPAVGSLMAQLTPALQDIVIEGDVTPSVDGPVFPLPPDTPV